MAFIYCVKNKINGKLYVGMTTATIEVRWSQHIREAKLNNTKSILHKSIRKYGVENFTVEKIEEVDDVDISTREKYWIKELKSFGANGYNLTVGGEGYSEYDSEFKQRVISYILTNSQKSVTQCAKDLKIDRSTCVEWLRISNNGWRVKRQIKGRPLMCLETNQLFDSSGSAADWLIANHQESPLTRNQIMSAIHRVAIGKTNNALGYKFRFQNCNNLKNPIARRIPVVCIETGKEFESSSDAAKWLTSNGLPKAKRGNITSCCKGKVGTAYGFTWKYANGITLAYESRKHLINKLVLCIETGKVHGSIKLATNWLKDIGFSKADSTNIVKVCKGKSKTAYGFTWKYVEDNKECSDDD